MNWFPSDFLLHPSSLILPAMLSPLPLSYCTNVHPGRSVIEVERGLDDYTVPMSVNYGAPLAAGLWLAAPVVAELRQSPDGVARFRDGLTRRNLVCHTLNAFPFGDFHSRRVKENVYIPDWSDPRRLEYTVQCAQILAALLSEGTEGSISTVPLAFKQFAHPPGHLDQCISQLLDVAAQLDRLRQETGRLIRLAIEPEPLCLLETTDETITFFRQLWEQASASNRLELAQRHLGVCYDVCHQAVEFEDIPQSIGALDAAEVRINKIHITCALQLDSPATNLAARQALTEYVEERYLHQTFAKTHTGSVLRQLDLSEALALHPPREFLDSEMWRVHFHVPVDAEHLGPLGTTRTELKQALATVAGLDYAPHLEVETYTWGVLPGDAASQKTQLIDGLTRELVATRQLLKTIPIQ